MKLVNIVKIRLTGAECVQWAEFYTSIEDILVKSDNEDLDKACRAVLNALDELQDFIDDETEG